MGAGAGGEKEEVEKEKMWLLRRIISNYIWCHQ